MTKFDRKFEHDRLRDALSSSAILNALLERWHLPGHPGGLRLAVRDGYLNFYACGQSVAKLSIGKAGPCLAVHHKYVATEGRGRPSREYRLFEGAGLASNALPVCWLDGWIEHALTDHTGAEKRFVDDLIAANPGTIDIEMALPGDEEAMREITRKDGTTVEKKVAPRMDLVVLQRGEASALELAFWEAKCADNSELRARDPEKVRVVHQLKQYQRWLTLAPNDKRGARIDEVTTAYRAAAAILEALARIANKPDCEARRLWREAEQANLRAVIEPGIVIGNYYVPAIADAADLVAKKAAAFRRNAQSLADKHLTPLNAITVVQYPDEKRGLTAPPTTPLPRLTGAMLPV